VRSFIKYTLVFGLITPIAFAATYFTYPVFHPAETKTKVVLPITKFTENLTSSFDIKNARVTIQREPDKDSFIGDTLHQYKIPFTSDDTLEAYFSGSLGLKSLTFGGSIKADLNAKELLNANFTYDGEKIYAGVNVDGINPKLVFTASSFLDVMNLIPMDGMGDITAKLGLGNINISELSNILTGLTDVSETYKDHDEYNYHFDLPIPFLKNVDGEVASIVFASNDKYEPKAIFAPKNIYLDGYSISLNVQELTKLDEDFKVTMNQDEIGGYKDADPLLNAAENIIPNIMDLVNKKAFDASYEVSVNTTTSKEISATGSISVDANTNTYGFSANLKDEVNPTYRGIDLNARYENKTTYINLNDGVLQGYLTEGGVNDIITRVEKILNKTLYNYAMDQMNKVLDDPKVKEIIANIDSLGKIADIFSINWNNDSVYVTVDTKALGFDVGLVTLTLNHSTKGLEAITAKGLTYKDYSFDFTLNIKDYEALPALDLANYCSLDSLSSLATIVPELINQKQFAANLNFSLQQNKDSFDETKDISIQATAQVDLNTKNYYGNININETSKIKHYVKFNMENNNSLYLLYDNADRLNDEYSTKAKIELNSIDEMYQMLQDFINKISNKDNPKIESLTETMNSLLTNPAFIAQVRNVAFNLTNDKLKFTCESLSSPLADGTSKLFNISTNMSLFGLEDAPISISIGYSDTALTYVEVKDIYIKDVGYINGKISLIEYTSEMLNSKLSPEDKYYDLNDIKTLLYLGLNTGLLSTNNYWYVTGQFTLKILGIDIAVPYNIYIHNNNTKVEINMDLTVSGAVMGLGLTLFDRAYASSPRYVDLFYVDGFIYINRTDRVLFASSTTSKYKMSLKDVLAYDKPIHVVTKDIMTFSSSITSKIDDSIAKSEENGKNNPTKYEQVLQDFTHNSTTKTMFIKLNFAELAHNTDMTKLEITITYSGDNDDNYMLSKAHIVMVASVGIDINLDFTLELKDIYGDYSNQFLEVYACREAAESVASSVENSY
jgi:hypothetical protein